MSDWKSRSKVVDAGSDWKSRSKPVESIPEAPPVALPVEESGPGAFSPTSKSGAALSGFSQGASMGFVDELGGAVGGGIGSIANGARSMLKTGPGRALVRSLMGGNASALPDAAIDALVDEASDTSLEQVTGAKPGQSPYDAVRNSMRSDDRRGSDAHPWIHGGSALAGGLALPLPGLSGKVLGMSAKSPAARALVGAGIGTLTGVGTSEGATASDVAGDAAFSGGFGMLAAPAVGAAADRFAPWLAARLQNASRENALKAVGLRPGITNKARQLGFTDGESMLQLGAKLRDEGDLIPMMSKPDAVAKRAEAMLGDAVDIKAGAIDELDNMLSAQKGKFNFNRLAQRAEADLMPKEGWDPLSREQAGKAFDLMGKASASQGGFAMADQVRKAAGNGINWKAASTGQSLPIEVAMQRRAYGGIADEILEQARNTEALSLLKQGMVPGADDLAASNQLAQMNKRISMLMDAKALSDEAATRDLAKSGIGLKEMMVGGSAGTALTPLLGPVAGPAAGLGVTAISGALRPRLPSVLTYAQNSASKTIPGAAKALTEPTIKALTADTSPIANDNAYQALMKRFGINAKSKEQLADEAFLLGQSNPDLQNDR